MGCSTSTGETVFCHRCHSRHPIIGSLQRLQHRKTITLNLPVTPVTTKGPAYVSGVIGSNICCDTYDTCCNRNSSFCQFDGGKTVRLYELIPCFIQRREDLDILSIFNDCDPPLFGTGQKLVQPFAKAAAGKRPGIGVAFTIEKVARMNLCDCQLGWPWA